jgi:hypothetical protein
MGLSFAKILMVIYAGFIGFALFFSFFGNHGGHGEGDAGKDIGFLSGVRRLFGKKGE